MDKRYNNHQKGAGLCPKINLTEQTIAQFDKFKNQIVFFGLGVSADISQKGKGR
jgi:hypothetical protein